MTEKKHEHSISGSKNSKEALLSIQFALQIKILKNRNLATIQKLIETNCCQRQH